MRNKGFFWFLTILLTVVCIYQLSFTWVTNNVEKKAEKEAIAKVEEEMARAAGLDSIMKLPNDTDVHLSKPEAYELAKAAYINDILKNKAETPVYPLFGSTFKVVKQRSLAFGLDLVGGMSVTLEISIPQLVESFALDKNGLQFKKPYDAALEIYGREGGDFVEIFVEQHKRFNPKTELVRLLAISDIDELGKNSTDQEVIDFLNAKVGSSMDGVEEIMNRRINQFGVAQPNIQKDPTTNRLYIELPGVQDEATVSEKLQTTANLQFFATIYPSEMQQYWDAADRISSTEQLSEIEMADSDTSGIEPDSLSIAEGIDTSTSGELKSLDSFDDFELGGENLSSLVMEVGFCAGFVSVDNKPKVERILERSDVRAEFPSNIEFMWAADLDTYGESKEKGYFLYAINVPESGKANVGGKDIANARTGYNQEDGKITVNLDMTDEGADRWAQMTQDNLNRIVAITMDNVVYSAPNVNSVINTGSTEISGSFTINEANDLAGLLNGGALPAPCVIKEQTKVGPTIGKENAQSGLISFGFALLVVFIYMIFYYGKAGIIADIALFANILFIFGSLASFGAVLTLAGIAGIVLTIGMAVDANVLIFERIREEQAAGKDLKSAVDTGFQKALSSIIDANVTTMLTAIVLKVFGSGPIESFATTLIIGIFTSLFAALVITRLSINWWLNKGKGINFESKVTKNAFKNLNFRFVEKRKIYYAISGILVIASVAAISMRKLNPSVEFSGGRTFGVKFEKSAEGQLDYVRENLSSVMVSNGRAASIEIKTKSNNYFLEITTNYLLSDETANQKVTDRLKEGLAKCEDKLGGFVIEESRSVSPTVSKELMSSSMLAIVLSLLIIFTYILIRFGRWQYSTGAIVAMVHDVIIVLGIFAGLHGILPFNMDVDQAFIAAILTVIGYSINDTVIVYDRIRENLSLHKSSEEKEQINISLNSTLSRTINTSMTTFIVLLIIFLFGGAAIKGFIFALMIGVLVGTYSSVCIATPILIDLSKKVRKTVTA